MPTEADGAPQPVKADENPFAEACFISGKLYGLAKKHVRDDTDLDTIYRSLRTVNMLLCFHMRCKGVAAGPIAPEPPEETERDMIRRIKAKNMEKFNLKTGGRHADSTSQTGL